MTLVAKTTWTSTYSSLDDNPPTIQQLIDLKQRKNDNNSPFRVIPLGFIGNARLLVSVRVGGGKRGARRRRNGTKLIQSHGVNFLTMIIPLWKSFLVKKCGIQRGIKKMDILHTCPGAIKVITWGSRF